MKVVRDSKFRHVHGDPLKEKYEDLRITTKIGESTGVRGNSKFIAFPWESGGGSTMAVLPVGKYGRQPRDMPLFTGHSSTILDHEFNPFNENMLMTCGEDQKIMLWDIPEEGLKSHIKEPLVELKGHQKKISFCTFNPTADGIIASTSFDNTVKIWNVQDQEEVFCIDLPTEGTVNHLKWNLGGNLIAATCKDKKLRIIDPRQKTFAVTAKIHEGAKPAKVAWLGGSQSLTDENFKLVTTGFTRDAGREISVWDIRKFDEDENELSEPLNMLSVDPGTGALFPFFDAGTQMLYVAGKGDGSIRYFEVVPDDPFLHFLSVYSATTAQKGIDFLPKSCMDTSKHEVARAMKMETNFIGYVSFKVPRKSKEFQEDIFPDCAAGVPSMSAEDWCGGAEPKAQVMRSMKPGAEDVATAAKAASASSGMVSVKDLKKQLAEAEARIQALEKENELLKAEIAERKK